MNRQYYGIEDISLTVPQRQTLIDAFKLLGRATILQPAYYNHTRIRNDGMAVIFEANFNDDDWTVDTVTNKLANLFGVNPAVILTSVNQTAYGPVVTFSAGGTDRMRVIAFGGLLASWEESHNAVLSYLSANAADWENSP